MGDGALLYDQIAHVTTKVSDSPGVSATITISPIGGGRELKARAGTSGKHATEILSTVGYLYGTCSAAESGPACERASAASWPPAARGGRRLALSPRRHRLHGHRGRR